MHFSLLVFILLLSCFAHSQIADASFFSSVRSLNPGIAHLRQQGLASLNVSQKKVEKDHQVTVTNVQDGVQTELEMQKNTFFYASKGGFTGFEILVDNETGEKVESVVHTTQGNRKVVNKASSNYIGGIFDFTFLGVLAANAKYSTRYKFRVGEPPSVSAKDIKTDLNYSLLKVGTAFNIKGFTFGAFGIQQTSKETYDYTFFDPSTGAQGTTETYDATGSVSGFGAGLGYTAKNFRVEASIEQTNKAKMEFDEDPQSLIRSAPPASRISGSAEVRFGKLSLGARVRNIVGNFTDLEELISSKLLYEDMTKSDSRLETSFNFGYGSDKGFSFSAFYTQSEAKTKEESDIFSNGELYPAVTKSSAYGASVTYYF